MKQVISMMVVVLCFMAGTARGYTIDPQIGVELVQINYGDVQGVYGLAKWLKSQDLLPVKADGMKMSVAEGYVKMCLKNFDTLEKCQQASLNLQPGQILKIFAPVVARATYDERLTKPFKEEAAAKDQKIAELEAMIMITKASAEKAEVMLKAAESETQGIKNEIAELQHEKTTLVSQNEELTARLGASRRAFKMLSATNADLKRELLSGLRTQISGLMKAFDESMDRRLGLASFDFHDLAYSIMLFSIACFVLALLLAGARAANEAHSAKIVERIREPRRQGLPGIYSQGGKEFDVCLIDRTPGARTDPILPYILQCHICKL